MAFVPLSYNARSLLVRRSSTFLTVLGIGATVAVLAGVLALQQGFVTLFAEQGRDDVIVFMRPGSTNEGDSIFNPERARILKNGLSEAARDEAGRYLVSGELYLALRRDKRGGAGETNVPVRGIEPPTLAIVGEDLRLLSGRTFGIGSDEVIVGRKLVERIEGCELGETMWFNVTPFRVVGVFDYEGPANSEIWGDRDRLADALERPIYNRIVARLRPGTDLDELKARYGEDAQVPCKVLTEREYLTSQTAAMSFVLRAIGFALATIMGVGAVFTAANTMLAALSARTHEIGILLSLGFRPLAIFLSFLFESLLLGLAGGAVGCLLALPLDRVDTGAMNLQTFTEVAFAFRITPEVLANAVSFALVLGLVGGAWPAWRAARLRPTEALRRE